MKRPHKLIVGSLLGVAAIVGFSLLIAGSNVAVLNPAGPIAERQRDLILIACLLMVIVVVPVFGFTFAFAWKYRASNKKATYRPDWDGNRLYETIWWVIPSVLTLFLAVITWRATHELDPFKPLASATKPLTVQVVALDWKWLFIYPQQRLATVNYLAIPEDTPINFEITADAPMNSFWIPQLGGQIYAMPGMSTKLHLEASKPGTYRGSSANLSGEGFADMVFETKAMTAQDFAEWEASAQTSKRPLNADTYAELAKPATAKQSQYRLGQDGLFDSIIQKYNQPQAEATL